jgi:hypothetical protein
LLQSGVVAGRTAPAPRGAAHASCMECAPNFFSTYFIGVTAKRLFCRNWREVKRNLHQKIARIATATALQIRLASHKIKIIKEYDGYG